MYCFGETERERQIEREVDRVKEIHVVAIDENRVLHEVFACYAYA